MSAVHVYSLADGKATQVTDGMSDASDPVWDRSGKYLFFTASTDSGSSLQPDIQAMTRTPTSSIYLIVLDKDDPSPLSPQSDEEAAAGASKSDGAEARGGAGRRSGAGSVGTGRSVSECGGAGRDDRLRQHPAARARAADAAARLHGAADGKGGHAAGT